MKSLNFVISLFLLSKVFTLITKYSSEEIALRNYVIFESKDFDDDDEMHFKMEAYEDDYISRDYVIYYYCTDITCNSLTTSYHSNFNGKPSTNIDSNGIKHITKYFTIKKQKSQYRNTGGNYMKLELPLSSSPYWAIITNTKDEGKIETWVIVVIVVVVVAIIAGIIIFCICRRIRNKRAMAAANATQVAVIQAQNQAYAAQNSAYAAQNAQNAYIAEQNYQAQFYKNQAYQDPNYMAPGSAPYTGYTSNAVF